MILLKLCKILVIIFLPCKIDKDFTLVAYIHNHAQGSCISKIVDPAILAGDGKGDASLEHQLHAVQELALTCKEEDPQRRPTMVHVTKQLRRIERFAPCD